MRAARCNAYGHYTGLTIEEVPDPVAGEGQVVVDVAAAAVNFPDVLLMADQYQIHVPVPFTPGSEFAGTVRAVGPGVENLSMGDPVAGASLVGAFAEQLVVPAASVERLAPSADLQVAAAAGIAHRTAYHALRSVASASTAEKLALCRERGADALVNYETENLKERIRELTGGAADVVIDSVGGRYAEEALRSLRWGGRFVSVGFASGEIPRIPLNLALLKGPMITGFTIEGLTRNQPDDVARDVRELGELLASGRVVPYISRRYPLEEAALALADLAERRATGKVLVVP